MIQLQNGCYCSNLSVYPKNWNTKGTSLKKDWFVYYRFYDPNHKDANGKIKPILKKVKNGINYEKTLEGRRNLCKAIMDIERKLLLENSYNPNTEKLVEKEEFSYEIPPSTPFGEALTIAKIKLVCESHTHEDIKSVLKYFQPALIQLKFSEIPINIIKRRHIKVALEHCGIMKSKTWTAATFNKYRGYLMMLFSVLIEYEAIEHNPVLLIKKMKTEVKLRESLKDDEREKVNKFLYENYYNFWRFMIIFFHSGCRIVEIRRVQVCQVDLKNQTFIATIKKGKKYIQVRKVIKNLALPLWKELIINANPTDYVFSKDLIPGSSINRREQITRRWKTHVKEKLGINADFYSLKHLHTTEVVDALNPNPK